MNKSEWNLFSIRARIGDVDRVRGVIFNPTRVSKLRVHAVCSDSCARSGECYAFLVATIYLPASVCTQERTHDNEDDKTARERRRGIAARAPSCLRGREKEGKKGFDEDA